MQQALPPLQQPHHQRRWLILGVIALAQLMVVLDVTVVTIALPSAQADLGFSDGSRQWVITAYALAFGSLLLSVRAGDTTSTRLNRLYYERNEPCHPCPRESADRVGW